VFKYKPIAVIPDEQLYPKQIIVMKPAKNKYNELLNNIGQTIETARLNAVRAVNTELVKANWEIGRHIVEFEQHGHERAEYGSDLLTKLSKDLKLRYGKGFGRRNVLDMRRFYVTYPIWQTVSAKLSWSHFILLLGVSDEKVRKFYEKQAINENLSKRELERQIDSSLFERLALSRDKKGVLQLSEKGHIASQPTEAIKDPYVLDFLKIQQGKRISEKHLEQKIIDNLQLFLLELGKGFTFVGRQFKISLRNKHFYIDLVFYHRILKCFILIDLKTKPVRHTDIGQMNLYLNYFKTEESVDGDNEPIGIILSADKDEVLVEYATGGISNKIFVSKYQLYLPDKKLLQKQVKAIMESE
jgi:predicted nuclease of restriction endonuclease-like (RecB) superfamily